MLHKLRFVLAGILIIVVNQAVTFAVSAHMPDALLAAGTTRFATAAVGHSVVAQVITTGVGFVDVTGVTKFITIPSGQTADVMVIFCAEIFSTTAVNAKVRALIRDVAIDPDYVGVDVLKNNTNRCMLFHKDAVSAGSPAIKIQVQPQNGDNVSVSGKSLVVIANLH